MSETFTEKLSIVKGILYTEANKDDVLAFINENKLETDVVFEYKNKIGMRIGKGKILILCKGQYLICRIYRKRDRFKAMWIEDFRSKYQEVEC